MPSCWCGRREDGWGDGDERSSSGEVSSMGRGDAVRQEGEWGDVDEHSSSGEVGCMGRGKGGRKWIATRGER